MSHALPRLMRGCITTTLALFALVLLAPALHAAPQIVTVDSVGNVGQYTSLALNASGQPVVSYLDRANSALKLATCTANCASASPTWQIVTVDSGGNVGEYTSLALNTSGQPVVSYSDATNDDLKLATCTANCASASPTWQIVTIDSGGDVGLYTSLALNTSGQPVVSYLDRTNSALKLATCTANCASASPTWQIVTVDSGGVVGQDSSLALNASGQPVVSYYDATNSDLKLATCTANCATASPTWQIVTVDSVGAVGQNTSLALNASGQPLVSYYDDTNLDLKLATCTASCATASPTWQIVTVDGGGFVGGDSSLALNASGQPAVSYWDRTNSALKLATCTANCATASPTWQIVTVDSVGDVGFYPSLALNTSGQPVVSYFDATNDDLKLATVLADFTVTASPNPASAGGLLTCAPTSGGTQAATAGIISGLTASCVATPNAGYTTQSISGCGGTATGVGVNSYTTGTVTANCTVTATFAPTTVGACGSANGVASLVAPTANLCSAGTASAVTTAAGNFNWTCSGSVAAITTDDASCAAPQQFTITSSPVGAGYLTCTTSTVNAGATVSCTATPFGDYITQSISGCGGTATGPGVNTFTTGAATANCTVSAVFVALQPVAVPTLHQWMLVVLALLVLGVASRSALSLREPFRRSWPR